MTTTSAEKPVKTDVSTGAAWALIALGSALPLILGQELFALEGTWLAPAQVVVLIAALGLSHAVPVLRRLRVLIGWLLAIAIGWHLVFGLLDAIPGWDDWQHSVPWVVRGAVVQALVFVPTLLLIAFRVARGSRRTLFLGWGTSEAVASRDLVTAGRRPRWSALGPVWAFFISVGTLTAMFFALPPSPERVLALLPALPMVMLLAATNTFNEEFQFRNAPLAFLPSRFGKLPALLMTASVFGLEHFYGNPPGASGVVLAGFLGYILAKSMVETGGSRWAWIIHWLQDVIIFSFLTMSWN